MRAVTARLSATGAYCVAYRALYEGRTLTGVAPGLRLLAGPIRGG